MDGDEEYEGQRVTAHHEAGHAIAAMKTGGRVRQMNICDRNEDDKNGYTIASYPDVDEAFYIYAGPWAEAKFSKPSETIDLDRVLGCLRTNADDWTAFQRATGHDVDDFAWISMQAPLAFGGLMPPEYRPNWAWHEKAAAVLLQAWDDGEIQALADQLLAHKRVIELRNRQLLRREGTRDCWDASDYYAVPDGGNGLVGPPPHTGRATH